MLFNLQGVALWQQRSFGSKTIVNMTSYPAGVYMLRIRHKEKVKTLRVVKL